MLTWKQSHQNSIQIGLCGAGIGGLAAAIALCRAGAQVTVLEAAPELGEIGAGIQMTPNVSRLLIKWGVADMIGENLVEFEELNMRRRNGTVSIRFRMAGFLDSLLAVFLFLSLVSSMAAYHPPESRLHKDDA